MAHKATYRRKRKQYKGNQEWIPFQQSLALLTLGDNIVLGTAILGAAFTRRFRVISVKANWLIRDLTAGEGPITCGYSHGDYTAAEIAEANDVALITSGDKIGREQASRLVRKVGSFRGFEAMEELVGNMGGEFIKTRLNWPIEEDFGFEFWAQNRSGAALTTGAILEITGEIYGKWE